MFSGGLVVQGYPKDKIYCSDKKREKLGYIESGKTRDKDLVEMERTIRSDYQIDFIPAIEEFFAFQHNDNGRMEAAEGSHDDCVSAACKCNFGYLNYKPASRGISVSFSKTWRG